MYSNCGSSILFHCSFGKWPKRQMALWISRVQPWLKCINCIWLPLLLLLLPRSPCAKIFCSRMSTYPLPLPNLWCVLEVCVPPTGSLQRLSRGKMWRLIWWKYPKFLASKKEQNFGEGSVSSSVTTDAKVEALLHHFTLIKPILNFSRNSPQCSSSLPKYILLCSETMQAEIMQPAWKQDWLYCSYWHFNYHY